MAHDMASDDTTVRESSADEPGAAATDHLSAAHSAHRRADHLLQRRLFVLDTNVLMHDPTAIYRFDEHVTKGSHDLQLRVTDGVGNTSVYEASFSR